MSEKIVSVIDIANRWNKRKQSIFKIIKKLKIETIKQNSSIGRGQAISHVTIDDEERINEYLSKSNIEFLDVFLQTDYDLEGVFYLIQLEPEHDPGRFKVGFATSIEERIRQHKCSAPLLKLIKTWPCKILWEKTAIDCVTYNCEKIHTEVFRTESLNCVLEKCDKFFDLMPKTNSDKQ